MNVLPKDVDVSVGQWFIVRCKRCSKKRADKYIEVNSGPDFVVYELPAKDEENALYVLNADLWNYLDPTRPYLKVVNAALWRKVQAIPGFKDFGSQEYSVVPHLLDYDAISGLVGSEEKVPAPVFAVGDKVKVIAGAFNGLVGTVVAAGDDVTPYRIAISVFGMNKEVELSSKEIAAPDEEAAG